MKWHEDKDERLLSRVASSIYKERLKKLIHDGKSTLEHRKSEAARSIGDARAFIAECRRQRGE